MYISTHKSFLKFGKMYLFVPSETCKVLKVFLVANRAMNMIINKRKDYLFQFDLIASNFHGSRTVYLFRYLLHFLLFGLTSLLGHVWAFLSHQTYGNYIFCTRDEEHILFLFLIGLLLASKSVAVWSSLLVLRLIEFSSLLLHGVCFWEGINSLLHL